MALGAEVKVVLHVDNSAVAQGWDSISEKDLSRKDWDARVDVDIWPAIAAEVVKRPDSVKIIKVKSHQNASNVSAPLESGKWMETLRRILMRNSHSSHTPACSQLVTLKKNRPLNKPSWLLGFSMTSLREFSFCVARKH